MSDPDEAAYIATMPVSTRSAGESLPQTSPADTATTGNRLRREEKLGDSRAPGPGVEVAIVFLIVVVAGLPSLGHVPFTDELLHVLAARSLLEHGTMDVLQGGGSYTRAAAFTYVVAGAIRVLGDSLAAARLPSLLSLALLVALMFVWVRSEVGRIGAWFAAMLMAFVPISLHLSQWARFYALQALLFGVGCWLAYRCLAPEGPRIRHRIAMSIGAVLALHLAIGLHHPTWVGVGALGIWVFVVEGPRIISSIRAGSRRRIASVGLVGLGLGGLVFGVWSGLIGELISGMTYADLWNESDRSNLLFYHDGFMKNHPFLWVLAPVAAVGALAFRPRVATLCLLVFAVVLVAHSLAAAKAERYIFYALPMFFMIWGIAVGSLVPLGRTFLARSIPAANVGARRAIVLASLLALATIVLYPAIFRPAALYAIREVRVGDARWAGWGSYHDGNPRWAQAGTTLSDAVRESDAIVVTDEIGAQFGLGRADFLIRRAYTPWQGHLAEFDRYRDVIPVVTTEESLRRVMSCRATGLVFVETRLIGREWTGIAPLVPMLAAEMDKLDVPAEWRIDVYRWDGVEAPATEARCEEIAPRTRPGASTAR
jgi:hypothetical protein